MNSLPPTVPEQVTGGYQFVNELKRDTDAHLKKNIFSYEILRISEAEPQLSQVRLKSNH